MEGDAWVISFSEVENRLMTGGCRRKILSILKALRDGHLELPANPISSYILKTLVLYECEKHPREFEWDESAIGDRLNGILLQLISCLQCKRCPHYFLPTLDLFKGKSPSAMENASKQVWRLLRELLTNTRAFEKLWNDCWQILNAITVVTMGLLKKDKFSKKVQESSADASWIKSILNSWARQATADVYEQVSNVCILAQKCVSTDFLTPFLIEIKTTVLYNDYQSYLK